MSSDTTQIDTAAAENTLDDTAPAPAAAPVAAPAMGPMNGPVLGPLHDEPAPEDSTGVDVRTDGGHLLGQIYLPKSGTGVGEFTFLLRENAKTVQIGTAVTATTEEGPLVGVVIDMKTIGSMVEPFDAEYSDLQARTMGSPATKPAEALKLATVQIFHADRLRSPSPGLVRPATASELLTATGVEDMKVPVPAGIVEGADGSFSKVCLDMHRLLGPEAGHLMLGGMSGAAAKTSYAGVLLKSAMHAAKQSGETMTAIVFNVKGSDLVNMDLPPQPEHALSDEDLAMYDALGVPAEPFEDVSVYAPGTPGGTQARSSRADAQALCWDLPMIWRYLKFLAPGLETNENMQALLGDMWSLVMEGNPHERKDTFEKLGNWFDAQLAEAEAEGRTDAWRGHHTATLRRAMKIIMSLPGRCRGLITNGKAPMGADIPVDMLTDGEVIVVDIAGLEPQVQAAVIARTCDRILSELEKTDGELSVEHVVIFADELNVFAPARGGGMDSVRKTLTKISATGRYAGVSLWGAAQFVSQVNEQIVGNAATRAAGILAESEVESGVFGRMSAGQRQRQVTLPRGQMTLWAPNLRGAMTVRFPRPAWCTGKVTGARRRPEVSSSLGLRPESLDRLTEGVDPETVAEVVATHGNDPDAAVAALERMRTPDMRKVSAETSNHFDADDPWDLD